MSIKNVLQYLEMTAARLPDKVAITDGAGGQSLTFAALLSAARRVGSSLCRLGLTGKRVAILTERHPYTVALMLGAVYAGAVYVPLDAAMPRARMTHILAHSEVSLIIFDDQNAATAQALGVPSVSADELLAGEVDVSSLDTVRAAQTTEDAMYIIFTSGSTGNPKGVVGCHRAVIDYAEALTGALGFDESCVFGCQSPLYFDAPFKELLTTLKCGATTCLVPRRLFSFPLLLLGYLRENRVNTICWVSSALSAVAVLGALEIAPPTTLRQIVFGSEVFSLPHFRAWRKVLPDAQFWQLYGPTEATGMSCYFKVDRDFADGERIPIGRPFAGTGLFLLGEDGACVAHTLGERSGQGEICLYGDCLTLGYDRDAERTNEAFAHLPCEDGIVRRVYRTGDAAYYNERDELIFVGRRDGQIKRMGHRIEIGEIEAAAMRCAGVTGAACAVRPSDADIVLFYTGDASKDDVTVTLGDHLPRYMLPREVRHIAALPHTDNGKIDRRALAATVWED
jgi:amino acid adenylation domain-containing protein